MLTITNISVKTRVLVAVVLMLSCTLGLGLFSVSRLSAVNLKAAEIRESWLPAVGLIGAIKGAFEYYRALEGSHLSSPSPEGMAEEEKTMASVLVDMDSLCRQYQSLVSPGYEAETFKKSLAIWKNYLETSQKKLLVLSRKNEKAAAGEVYRGESYEGYWRARDLFQDLVVFNVDGGKGATDQGAEIYAASKVFIVVLATLATILSLVAGWVIIATVSRPIQTMTGVMNRLAEHDLETMVGGIERKDEIGAMARAVQVFKDGLIEADRLSAEQAQEHEVKRRRAEAIDRLLEGFEKTATSALRTVSMAAAALDTTASSMSDLARQTSTQANLAAAAAEETSSNVQTVSAATDEMTSAIREIGIQVTTSTRIAGEAVDEATRTNETVRGLAEAVQKIGDVVGLITNIASQTNLLALNATIEAARAGEAGKGFAIVAGEVKNLATQTAKATDEISAQIAAIQSATGGAVQAIGGIGTTIARINDIATAIAAATEEQGAVTAEISRNVQQAASATQHVTSNILQVTQAAGDTGTAAGQVKEAAGAMARQAETLRIDVEHFLTAIKAT